LKSGGNLKPADFAQEGGAQVASAPSTDADPPPANATAALPQAKHASTSTVDVNQTPLATGPVAASEGITDVAVVAGPPEAPKGPKPDAIGAPVLVDAKIGDVNGKPVYASRFLEPMGDRLRARANEYAAKAEAARSIGKTPPDWRPLWRSEAKKDIDSSLNTFIEDELLRAEAIASFTPEMKQGFFNFMRTVSEKVQSENLGSRSAANQSLQNQGGLEGYLRTREEKELIQFQLYQKINRRINIAWRDIKLEYDRWVAAAPAFAITIRRIEIKASNADAIKELEEKLASNADTFAKLANSPANLNNPEGGGLEKLEVKGDPAAFLYYGRGDDNDPYRPLNDAARSLKSGETVGPIKVGNYMNWLHRDEDRTLPPLYLAQLMVENDLRARRVAVEKAKYIERLKAKTTMTSVKDMSAKLLEIAEDRYVPKKVN
jgi:hypothetical protein